MEIIMAKLRGALLGVFLVAQLAWSADIVVALHPAGDDFNQALQGVRANLGDEVGVQSVVMKKGDEWGQVKGAVLKLNPQLFVLMDNQAIKIYKQYRDETQKAGKEPLSAVALMALQLDKVTEGMNMAGISYEIPVVTSVVNLRAVSSKPIRSVGVIYRKGWEGFVQMNASFCQTEKVSLVGYAVPDDGNDYASDLQKGLKNLIGEKKVDAIWVLNDNKLLNNQTIVKAWIPGLSSSSVPVIVGVETLIQTKFNLGTFAVLPDHAGLGGQVANMIFEIKDNDWKVGDRQIDQPLSVIKMLNSTLARKKGFLREDGLSTVDREVK